jgi:cytochrome c
MPVHNCLRGAESAIGVPDRQRPLKILLPATMTRIISIFFVALMACAGAAPAVAAEPLALLEQYRCSICHADREVLAGPSWADIALRYKGQRQAEVIVSTKIQAGARGSGLWNMPPHPEVSKADAAVMARYILTIKE